MHSSILSAFAVWAASVHLVSASACQSRRSSSLTTLTTSPATSTTTTPTASVTASATTNAVTNPDFSNGLSGYTTAGNVTVNTSAGYQGDGSTDTDSVQLAASSQAPQNNKRQDTGTFASIEQQLSDLDTASQYTAQFFYQIVSNSVAGTCRIEALYGSTLFNSTPYFPVVASSGSGSWVGFTSSMPITSPAGLLQFTLECGSGGNAVVLIDSIFVSTQNPGSTITASLTQSASASSSPTLPTCAPLTGQVCPANPTPSAALICQQSGNVPQWSSGYSPSVYPYQGSSGQCAIICSQLPGCLSSAYQTTGNSCLFLNLGLRTAGFVANEGSTIWSDKGCYDCPDCTKPSTTTATTTTTSAKPTSTCALYNGQGCPLVNPPPSGHTCLSTGYLNSYSYLASPSSYPYQGSVAQCAAACERLNGGGCTAFAYDSEANECLFSDESLNTSDFTANSTSTSTWSDLACFSCPFCAQ